MCRLLKYVGKLSNFKVNISKKEKTKSDKSIYKSTSVECVGGVIKSGIGSLKGFDIDIKFINFLLSYVVDLLRIKDKIASKFNRDLYSIYFRCDSLGINLTRMLNPESGFINNEADANGIKVSFTEVNGSVVNISLEIYSLYRHAKIDFVGKDEVNIELEYYVNEELIKKYRDLVVSRNLVIAVADAITSDSVSKTLVNVFNLPIGFKLSNDLFISVSNGNNSSSSVIKLEVNLEEKDYIGVTLAYEYGKVKLVAFDRKMFLDFISYGSVGECGNVYTSDLSFISKIINKLLEWGLNEEVIRGVRSLIKLAKALSSIDTKVELDFDGFNIVHKRRSLYVYNPSIHYLDELKLISKFVGLEDDLIKKMVLLLIYP